VQHFSTLSPEKRDKHACSVTFLIVIIQHASLRVRPFLFEVSFFIKPLSRSSFCLLAPSTLPCCEACIPIRPLLLRFTPSARER